MSITFLTFKWRPFAGYRSKFDGETVNVLRRMIARNYSLPHRFVCVTDDPAGITEPGIEIYRLWDDHALVANPSNAKNPSCYRRLKVFARNAGDWLGERFVCIDLDAVVTGRLEPLFADPPNFRIWKSATGHNPYNGSMWMLRAGAHPEIWEDFDPLRSPLETKRAGFYGSDQGWFGHVFGPSMPTWSQKDGVYSYRSDLQPHGQLPPNARIVFFHGKTDPWSPEARNKHAWVREHYR